MGSCLSAHSDHEMTDVLRTAKVIAIDGSLREYSVPTKVSEVLDEKLTASFLCSSDELYLDRDIPALRSQQWVELDQIYFILPRSMLDQPLTGQDMAALAVKASLALAGALAKRSNRTRGKRSIQVVPIHKLDELDQIKIVGDYNRSEQLRNRDRASVKGRHSSSRLAAIREAAE
ncbi:HTH-type transcriptional regulator [Rhynchospora pubera]|uniref:HTH-type transcriptional regulator n=1 Tax=Rhynchospora pubera TaxID=906938 RepID=A0AAV8CW02_9POAL|nr:HTH-type transcriptional regulator [Rhynchospora pubera]